MKFISLNVDPTKDMVMSLADGGGGDTSIPTEMAFTFSSVTSLHLQYAQDIANGVTVDWGDGSPSESTDSLTADLSHSYSAGNYDLKLYAVEGSNVKLGAGSAVNIFGRNSDSEFITSLVLGDNISSIEANAFNYCTNLTQVYVATDEIPTTDSGALPPSVTHLEVKSISGWLGRTITTNDAFATLLSHNGTLYVNGSLLVDLVVPSDVVTITDNAMKGCTCLESVVIPATVTTLGKNAFLNCTSLLHAEVGAVSIGAAAFRGCTSMTAIWIRDTVLNITASKATEGLCYGNSASMGFYLEIQGSSYEDYPAGWGEYTDARTSSAFYDAIFGQTTRPF